MHRTSSFLGRACATITLVACVATAIPTVAFAQNDKAGAQVLLNQGLALKKDGKYAEACPKLEESLRLYPSINTQYHLADCHELEGKTASAWIDFQEVADKAKAAGESAKEAKARERAAAIAPKVSYLTIEVASEVPGLEVKRAGKVLGKGVWGARMPVDPGEYEVVAAAPGYVSYSAKFTVKPGGSDDKLTIPALAAAPPDTTTTTGGTDTTTTTTGTATTSDAPSGGSSRKMIGLIVGGTGIVLMGVGGILALGAKSKYDGADCAGSICSQSGADARDSARSTGTVATILFGVGAAALIGGGVLWLTAPSSSSSASLAPRTASNDVSIKAGITPGGFMLGGSF
jgi:hypothetical protein